jgi:hypothetical protein
LLATHTIHFVVHIQGRADMVRDDAEPIADTVATIRARDIQVPVLLGQLFNYRRAIFFHESEADAIFRLVPIRRERLRSAIDNRVP